MQLLEQAGLGEVLGVAGFALYALAYAALSLGRLTGESAAFYALNGMAALAVLASLGMDFNLGSALIQIFYLCVSLAGLLARLRRAGATAPPPAAPSSPSPR